ncbi:MAG: matrixin family metalloprotease [Acidimicrobiia bacterium]
MKHRVAVPEPLPVVLAGLARESSRPFHTRPSLRVALVVMALVWTQFPLGGGARAEGGQDIELCCAWGRTLGDGALTYSVSAGDAATADVIRAAVREWDDVVAVSFVEVAAGEPADVTMSFTEYPGRTEGQAVTSFTQRGLIRRVEVTIKGGRAPENSGGIIQIAKHEFGHALGLGHANFDGTLMSEAVSPEPSPIPACAINGVTEANRWKLADPESRRPHAPELSEVPC